MPPAAHMSCIVSRFAPRGLASPAACDSRRGGGGAVKAVALWPVVASCNDQNAKRSLSGRWTDAGDRALLWPAAYGGARVLSASFCVSQRGREASPRLRRDGAQRESMCSLLYRADRGRRLDAARSRVLADEQIGLGPKLVGLTRLPSRLCRRLDGAVCPTLSV
jgi:hypothetical protein